MSEFCLFSGKLSIEKPSKVVLAETEEGGGDAIECARLES